MKQKKPFRYLKVAVYLLGGIVFYDLLINPQGMQYADADFNIIPDYFRTATALTLIVLLALLAAFEFLKPEVQKRFQTVITIVRILFLPAVYFDLDYCLRVFNFHQVNEYVITSLIALPLIPVLKDLLLSVKVKTKLILLTGLLLCVPAMVYFEIFYEPYEDYRNGIPIMFFHYQLRNWAYFSGTVLLSVTLLRWLETKQKQ